MKKGIIISAAALLALAGLFIFSTQYRDYKEAQKNITASYSTLPTVTKTTTETTTEKALSGVIVENKEGNYQMIVENNEVIITHGEYRSNFGSVWNNYIKAEMPEMYYHDFDGDGKKELILKMATDKFKSVATGEYVNQYSLFLLDPHTTSKGEKVITYNLADKNSWKSPFENAIRCELTQLKSCDKILQFAMNNKDRKIIYDENTGITKNKYAGYATARKGENGAYYTMRNWSKDLGIYDILDDGTITLDIQVLVSYQENNLIEQIGNIHCEMIVRNKSFDIKPNSIKFVATEGHKAYDPRKSAQTDWQVKISNSSEAPAISNKALDWIKFDIDVTNAPAQQNLFFSEKESKIKYIDEIIFDKRSVTLIAKSGYGFSSSLINSQCFSVAVNAGTKNQVEIGYQCSETDIGSQKALVITFDRTYDQKDLKNLAISFSR
ncbi:MAG: hypothetical protein NC213_01165 [Acetobacter sp.]|nr:hypothetical protein [Bacteroides sp.]MCM1340336.1 hypothetical protein [Acetobacter sp.]MCM1433017.1 hypothetical protein [Clostridiales bacterium]